MQSPEEGWAHERAGVSDNSFCRHDPDIDLDVVAGSARTANVNVVLSTSLGFWGAQAALILEPV